MKVRVFLDGVLLNSYDVTGAGYATTDGALVESTSGSSALLALASTDDVRVELSAVSKRQNMLSPSATWVA